MNARTLASPLVVAALLVAASFRVATAAPEGPAFGTGKISAAITDVDGEPDTDDYVAPMLAGETLTVSVAATGKSKLHPAVQVIDPTGTDRTPAVKRSKSGDAASFKGLTIGVTGRWTVRISGDAGTQGAYTASFQQKAAPRFGTKKSTLGGTVPRTTVHTFEATQGSFVTLTLRPLSKKSAVQLTGATAPGATPYPEMRTAASVKSGVTTLKRFEVQRGSGTYSVTVTAPDDEGMKNAPVKYRLDLTVSPSPRPKGTKKLTAAEPRLLALATPLRAAVGFPATFAGHDLRSGAAFRVLVGGRDAEVNAVTADGTSVTIIVPDVPAPSLQDVVVVNPDGQSSSREGFVQMVAAPVVIDVRDAFARSVRKAPLVGGDALRIIGDGFDAMTTVAFGGIAVPVTQVLDAHTLAVTSPVASRSVVTVSVADDFGRVSTSLFTFLFPYAGWGEGDTSRLPAPDATDDYSAGRALAVDLDGDGRADDLVIASPIRSYAAGGVRHGTRETATRVLIEKADRTFADATAARVPAAFGAAFPYDTDDLNAQALAIGDLDGTKGPDLVLAGFAETYFDGFGTDTLYGSNRFVAGVRALRNGGAGSFAFSAADQGKPQRLRPDMSAKDGNGVLRPLLGPYATDRGDPAAIAIGDLDKDGRADVVVTRAEGGFRRVRQDVTNVDFTKDPPTIPTADADAYVASAYRSYAYVAGTEILENRFATGGALTYATERRMPLAFGGYGIAYQGPAVPGFHGDDVALGDIDHDGDLDMVVAWHDPVTVSIRGLKDVLDQEFAGAAVPLSLDGPRVATRVLLNDGAGHFTDATDTWMPAGSGAEFWQARRIALTDLDGDGWADLTLLDRDGLDVWTARALSDMTVTPTVTTASPGQITLGETDTYQFHVPTESDCVIEATLGTLPDSVIKLYGPDSQVVLFATDDDGGYGAGSRLVRTLGTGTWYVQVTGFSGTDAGTYTLSVRGRLTSPPLPSHAQSALRILRNDSALGKFVDATATALPALPDGDDFRGGALRVADVDGDGRIDLLVATTEELKDSAQKRIRSLRLFLGAAGGVWTLASDQLPPAALDSGQADDILVLPSPDGVVARSILLVSRAKPVASQGGRLMRLLDWNR